MPSVEKFENLILQLNAKVVPRIRFHLQLVALTVKTKKLLVVISVSRVSRLKLFLPRHLVYEYAKLAPQMKLFQMVNVLPVPTARFGTVSDC